MPLICEKKPPPERCAIPRANAYFLRLLICRLFQHSLPIADGCRITSKFQTARLSRWRAMNDLRAPHMVHAARTQPAKRSKGRNRRGRWMDRFRPTRVKRRRAPPFARETVSDASDVALRNY